MSLTYQTPSTPVFAAAANPTSINVPYAGTATAGDLMIAVVGLKPSTATITTPSGWTAPANSNITGGAGAAGADTGPLRIAIFTKIATGGETGNLAVTVGSPNIAGGFMYRITATSKTYEVFCSAGSDNTAGSAWSVTGGQSIHGASGDKLLNACAIPTDATTGSWTSESITLTGCTTSFDLSSTPYGETTVGNDMAIRGAPVSITAGSGTAAPAHTATVPATATNVAGPEIFIRVREGVIGSAEAVAITAAAQQPTLTATSAIESVSVLLNVELAAQSHPQVVAIAATAQDATVSTQGDTSVNAQVVTIDTVTNDPTSLNTVDSDWSQVWATVDLSSFTNSDYVPVDVAALTATVVTQEGDPSPEADPAILSAVAEDPGTSALVPIEAVEVAVATNDSTVNILVVAEAVGITVAGNDGTTIVTTASEVVAITVATDDAPTSTRVSADVVSATIAAEQPVVLMTAEPTTASVVAATVDPLQITSSSIEVVPVGVAALQPTVSTENITNVSAGIADVTVVNNDSTTAALIQSGFTALTTAGQDITSSSRVSAEAVLATAEAQTATVTREVQALAEAAELSVGSNVPTVDTQVLAGVATISSIAVNAIGQTIIPEPDLVITRRNPRVTVKRTNNTTTVVRKVDRITILEG